MSPMQPSLSHGDTKKALSTFFFVLVCGGGAVALAQEAEPAAEQRVRFAWVDVTVDAKDAPLAAYQFEFAAETGTIRIVGVEGGEHAAFREAPYYDPAALKQGRIIIAAFNTGRDLPKGRTRVARLHLQVVGDVTPEYVVKLTVAAGAEGKPIQATAAATPGEAR